jgi:hypothetical protein
MEATYVIETSENVYWTKERHIVTAAENIKNTIFVVY